MFFPQYILFRQHKEILMGITLDFLPVRMVNWASNASRGNAYRKMDDEAGTTSNDTVVFNFHRLLHTDLSAFPQAVKSPEIPAALSADRYFTNGPIFRNWERPLRRGLGQHGKFFLDYFMICNFSYLDAADRSGVPSRQYS